MTDTHTVFDRRGKWHCVTAQGIDHATFEAKWHAATKDESMIVKEGFIEECGAEAVAIVTPGGRVF